MTGKEEMVTKIIFASQMSEDKNFEVDAELLQAMPMVHILKNKVDGYKMPIRITQFAYMLMGIYSEGNPAFIQYLLAELIKTAHSQKSDLINVSLMCEQWPFEYPKYSDFSIWWDKQKDGNRNRVDTAEFWNELFA